MAVAGPAQPHWVPCQGLVHRVLLRAIKLLFFFFLEKELCVLGFCGALRVASGHALCGWHLPGWRCCRDGESEGLWALCSFPPWLGSSVTFQHVKSGVAFLSISPDGCNRPRSCGAADCRGDISAKQGCDAGVCRPEGRAPAPPRHVSPCPTYPCAASLNLTAAPRGGGSGRGRDPMCLIR